MNSHFEINAYTTHTSDTDLNVAHYMEFHLKPKITCNIVLPFTPLRTQNCMFKVVSISPAFVKHVVLIDNILYVTWKGITWINTLAGVSWPATSQAVVQLWYVQYVVLEPPCFMHKGVGAFHVRFNQLHGC